MSWLIPTSLWSSPQPQNDHLPPEPNDSHLPLSSFLSYIPHRFHSPLRSLLISSLHLGPLPSHVAFIMDGNRRFARSKSQEVRVGHEEGFEALKRVLSFFLKLEIKHVTVYAFSIENFNRDQREVDQLMGMARERLVEICEKGQLLDRYGVQIRVLGRRDLLPLDVQESCRKAEEMTKNNTRGILNLCCPYTSQEEMTTSISRTISSSLSGEISLSDITEKTLNEALYTSSSPPLDILIRTSGVNRLSDFLLWQANDKAVLHFIPPNWPDIGVLDILPPLLSYQGEVWAKRVREWFF